MAALPALGWWLVLVGAVRLGFAWSGFFDARAVRAAAYSNTHGIYANACGARAAQSSSRLSLFSPIDLPVYAYIDSTKLATYMHRVVRAVTDVHGRTVGAWTLLSCTLCFLCAFNLQNKPLCAVTFLSFVYAYGHLVVEYLVYRTITAASLGTLGFFAGNKLMDTCPD